MIFTGLVHGNTGIDLYTYTYIMAAASEFRAISKVVALVTGAASGLGRATAARLARQVRYQSVYINLYMGSGGFLALDPLSLRPDTLCIALQGARVVVADLKSSDGEATAKEMGDNATFVATDVSEWL